ncbi:hypothetical protein [uncultured Campylobacter sp.]|nr:hypothetical protein [uncultured Campylobacter sp.]
MKEFYPEISTLLILMMPVAAECNQSVAASKKIKFTSPADLNLNLYHS